MKQSTNDNIIRVITEWEQYEVKLNWDCSCEDLLRHFCDILHGMTYHPQSIIDSLRSVADTLEREVVGCRINDNNEENEDLEDYGTTD